MARRPLVALAAGLVVLAASREGAPESWLEVKTPGFTVVSDGSEKEARTVAARFEQMRALLKLFWPWARLDTPRPVTILAVRDEGGLRQLLPGFWERKGAMHPAGLFVSAPERNWVALRMDVTRFREDDDSWRNPYLVVFHEYVHLILGLNFEELPVWLNEGLAEYWGSTVVQDDRVYMGHYSRDHLRTLRERAPLSLARLFAVTHGSPEYSEENRAGIFYAESWALVHYLVLGSEARRGQIDRLARLLHDGRPAEAAATESFGDTATLERELFSYVRRSVFRSLRARATVAPDARDFTARPLSDAEALAVRAAFHVAMNRPSEARALAGQALALQPKLAAAHEALGLMAWREGKVDEARQALGRATELSDASDFAHYLHGRLQWQQAGDPEDLEVVEAAFRRAIELNPSFAAAISSLAQVMDARGEPLERTLPLAVQAAVIEPAEIGHQIAALRLAGRRGEIQEARVRAEALRDRVTGPDRARVEDLIAELSDPTRLPPEAACAAGSAEACAYLGARHHEGREVAKDLTKAAEYFQKACAAGKADSCAALGWAFERGEGVGEDLPRAIPLYRKACDGGDRWSCTRLGIALAAGEGTSPDPAVAARLFDASCEGGDDQACAKLGSMYRLGIGVAKDAKKAETLLSAACDRGSAGGCAELGGLLVGLATPGALTRGAGALDKACERDLPEACAMLAHLVEVGNGVPRDPARARMLYRKACDAGYTDACARAAPSRREAQPQR